MKEDAMTGDREGTGVDIAGQTKRTELERAWTTKCFTFQRKAQEASSDRISTVIPGISKRRQGDLEFKANWSYIVKS